MTRYEGVNREVAAMLIKIEANEPDTANRYMERFGLTELPVPFLAENDSRQYRTWQLQPIRVEEGIVGYDYVKSHVPADRGGYIQALSNFERFDIERPTDTFDVDGNLVGETNAKKSKAKSGGDTDSDGASG